MTNQILPDLTQEATRVSSAIQDSKLSVKLLGGLAVWLQSPSAQLPILRRDYSDLDFIAVKKEVTPFSKLLTNIGYMEDKRFNAIHGATRLIFIDEENDRPVDLLVDNFKMCHEIDLKNRLSIEGPTISISDLFLTKLQVVKITKKDLLDLTSLIIDHEFSDSGVDLKYITKILSGDWGFERTVLLNLDRLLAFSSEILDNPKTKKISEDKINIIKKNIRDSKKNINYKLRAKVGERVIWYEEPDELIH